jgi:hypothetical protein
MYRVLLISLLTVAVWVCQSAASVIEVDGNIYGDTTWTDQDTILIPDKVTVLSAATLTIEPGTVVLMGQIASLEISGDLVAEGTEAARILFTSWRDVPGSSPAAGDWRFLYFRQGGSGVLRHCHIRYGLTGVQAFGAPLTFGNCLIEDFLSTGIYSNQSNQFPHPELNIIDCTIRQTTASLIGTGQALYTYGTIIVNMSGTQVYDCNWGAHLSGCSTGAAQFDISHCDIHDNTQYGLRIFTST